MHVFIQKMNNILTEPTVTQEPVFYFQNPSEIKTSEAKLWTQLIIFGFKAVCQI